MDTATIRGVITTCVAALGIAMTPLVASAAIDAGRTNSDPSASATPSTDTVTFILEGEITGFADELSTVLTDYFQVGDKFSVEYTFDRNAVDSMPDPHEGVYEGSVLAVSIAIGDHTGSGSGGAIGVGNDYNEVDYYIVAGAMSMDIGDGLSLDSYYLGLNDESATAFDSDALPIDPRQLDGLTDFNWAAFTIWHPFYGAVRGRIDSASHVDIDIDIEPGSDANTVNIDRPNASIEVALLGSASLHVSDVDVPTLRFGATGTEATPIHNLDKKATRKTHLKDVNGDGYTDLITHYRVGDTGLVADDTVACLTASSQTGQSIQGCDRMLTESTRAVGPPISRPVGPPDGAPVGPPISPPVGPPISPPAGPPASPPVGPPISPPAGPPVSPPTSPPANRPLAPMYGGFVEGLGGSVGLIGTIVVALGFMLLTANGAASTMTASPNRNTRGRHRKPGFSSQIALLLQGFRL